jgi:hypothetical protein
MTRTCSISTALLAGLLALGCNERPDVAGPAVPQPAHTVSRFTDFVGDFVIDEEQQLSALVGRSYETLVSVCTTGEDDPDTGLVQVVERPDGSINILTRATDVNVVLWTTVLPPDDCGLFLTTAPFATGTVRFISRVQERTEDGSFNLIGTYVGTVTSLETGQRYHFLFTAHIRVTPSGQVHFSGGDIKLRPIGG